MKMMFGKSKSRKADASESDSSGPRLLTVEVVEAKGLKALNKSKSMLSSPTSDPYGEIGLIDIGGREIKTETFKLPPKVGTIAPKWNKTFEFGQHYDLSNEEHLPNLVLSLFHKGQYDFSPTPLGKVEITSDALRDLTKVDKWYPLMPDQGKVAEVSGEIHLKLSFNKPAGEGSIDEETGFLEDQSKLDKAIDGDQQLKEETESQEPNTIKILLKCARNLPAKDRTLLGSRTTSDPYVTFKVKNCEVKKSKTIDKNCNPVWNETILIEEVLDPSETVECTVYDENNVKFDTELGKFFIPLHTLYDKQQQNMTLPLISKTGANDGKDRGEVDVKVQWIFDPNVHDTVMKKKAKAEGSLLGKLKKLKSYVAGDTDSEDELQVNDAEEEEKDPMSEADKKKKEEEEKEKKKELEEIDIKTGDYQVLVHVIEARDLKAENFDGTSDPVVYISAFDQKVNTKVVNNVTSCVFDEVFVLNFPNLDKSTFNEGFVRLAVYDSSILPGNKTMIGAFAMDAAQIYCLNKDHEYYRQWVPLMDDEQGADVGVQGYLKITIQIIGPGEKIKVHDEMADIQAELAKESKVGNDVSSLIGHLPVIQREWLFLVVSVFRLEGLPIMDGAVGVRGLSAIESGTDAFCSLSFAGGKPLRTKVKTVKGKSRDQMNFVFNCDMWYPISVPTMTQVAKFSVFDSDPTSSELIGLITEKYRNIENSGRRMHLKWYNMYGCPEFKQGKITDNAVKLVKGIAEKVEGAILGGIDYGELYNNVPDRATSWKGRALLQFRIETPDKRPESKRTPEIIPFRRKLKPLPLKSEPATAKYVLKALIFSGANLPGFTGINLTSMSLKQDLHVRIVMGPIELSSKKAPYEKGMCRWNDLKTASFSMPKDATQLPDIFIYLCKSDGKQVTFYRMKPAKITKDSTTLLGFDNPAEWYLFQEDKSVNALGQDEFPGTVLIRLGFGLETDATASEQEWNRIMEETGRLSSYQMRIHVYQGDDLPAADSNGLSDPVIKAYFLDKQEKTKVRKQTLYPAYYESLVFDDISIPDVDNFRYAPIISFRLYDEDFGTGLKKAKEYLGTFNFLLKDAFVTQEPHTPVSEYPDPKWYNFFKEVVGDGQGRLLLSVQLIPKLGRNIPIPNPMPSIVPETEPAYIELIALGIRELQPYNFTPIVAPFLELELNSFGSSFYTVTNISKKPTPSNPNFLEKLTMEVVLPKKSIYATPLQIRCRDSRLGGFYKPIIGVGVADLSEKLPWTPNYKAPQTEVFIPKAVEANTEDEENGQIPGANNDEVAQKINEELKKKEIELMSDTLIATPELPSIEEFVKQRKVEEDTGAGVFGALNHIDFDVEAKKKRLKTEKKDYKFQQVDFDEIDEPESPPAWKIGRRILVSDLETDLQTSPFETYKLTRGKVKSIFGSTLKVAGIFKGIIRVKKNKSDPDIFSKEMVDYFTKPKAYKIRLYCLHAFNLTPMDKDLFGRATTSDPYLRITLGKSVFNDRKNYIPEVKECDFYKLIEFDAELPGTSQLIVEVVDRDTIGSDDLIGKTVIDLEDRWFDGRWQNMGIENMIQPGDPGKPNAVRWATKPVERRTLYSPASKFSQGILECYLDIMTPDDVSLPPKQIFQFRVVIWKSKNVPPMDSLEKMSDLYVKVWPEGCKPLETDTHWRCKKGKASWNYRLLFDVEVGHSTRIMKFPYLHFQLWDRDLLKWNDCAGEFIFEISKYLNKAYRKNIPIKLFEKPQGAMKRRAEKKQQIKRRDPSVLETGEDVPEPEPEIVKAASKPSPKNDSVLNPPPDDSKPVAIVNPAAPPVGDSDDEDDTGLGAVPRSSNAVTKRRSHAVVKATAGETRKDGAGDDEDKKKEKKGWSSWFNFFGNDEEEEEDDDNADDGKDDDKDEDSDSELKELISTFKSITGLWEDDPPDSKWLDLQQRDHNTNKVTPMGSISFSLQIWPKDKATIMSVGSGRNEPNNNPYLPPPVGRLKFSWNPFVLGSELCGPVLCAQLFCCLICISFILLMVFAQPFLTLMINIIFFFG